MAGREREPFETSLEVERGSDGVLGREVSLRSESLESLAEEGLFKGVDRVDRMSPARKAIIYSAVGGLSCVALWSMKLFFKDAMQRLSEQDFLPTAVVGISCVAAYGLLQLISGPIAQSLPESGSGAFGGFAEAHAQETLWKRRLLAVALGLGHAGLFLFS